MSSTFLDTYELCCKDMDYLNKLTLAAMDVEPSHLRSLINVSMVLYGYHNVSWFTELHFIYGRTLMYGKIFESIRRDHFLEGVGPFTRSAGSPTTLYRRLADAQKRGHIIKLLFNYGSGRRPIPVYGLNLSVLVSKISHTAGFRRAAAMELQEVTKLLSTFGKVQTAINCNGGNKFMKIEDAFGEAVKKSETAKKRREVRASKRKKGGGSMTDKITDWLVVHGFEKPIWTGRTKGKLGNLIKDFDGDKEKTYEFITACFEHWGSIKYRFREDDYIKIGDTPNFERVYNLRDKMKLFIDNKANKRDVEEGLEWVD